MDVSADDNNLTIRGEKRFEREESGRNFFFSEREYGSFQRTFRLPPDASSDKIDAEFTDGVLCLMIAKVSPTKSAGRKINIRTDAASFRDQATKDRPARCGDQA